MIAGDWFSRFRERGWCRAGSGVAEGFELGAGGRRHGPSLQTSQLVISSIIDGRLSIRFLQLLGPCSRGVGKGVRGLLHQINTSWQMDCSGRGQEA